MRSFRKLTIVCLICVISAGISGCTRTLTYGESTGFNLGIEADLATDDPAEINLGFKRRVIGVIPPQQDPGSDGRTTGEAANMLSRFEIDSESNPESIFSTTVAVRGAFASGAAARGIVADPERGASVLRDFAGVEPITVRVSDDPVERAVSQRLLSYVAASEQNRERYLAVAAALGLTIPDSAFPTARAMGAINAPENAVGNQRVAAALGQ